MMKILFLILSYFLSVNVNSQPFVDRNSDKLVIEELNLIGQELESIGLSIDEELAHLKLIEPERIGTESILEYLRRQPEWLKESRSMLNDAKKDIERNTDQLKVVGNTLVLGLLLKESGSAEGLAYISQEICWSMDVRRTIGFANIDAVEETAELLIRSNTDWANAEKIPSTTLQLAIRALNAERKSRIFLLNLCKRMGNSENWN